jgi:chorismate mutase
MPFTFPPSSLLRRHLLIGVLGLLTGCTLQGTRRDTAQTLPDLMVERLSWMDHVARAKQARSLPVNDPQREAELLRAMEIKGTASGLPTKAVRDFFTGQIEAAKQFQQEWIAAHPHTPSITAVPPPDLTTHIRPALDAIGKRMIAALKHARGSRSHDQIIRLAREKMLAAGYSNAVIAPAIEGLTAGLKRSP